MQLKPLTAIIVLSLLVGSLSIAGFSSSSNAKALSTDYPTSGCSEPIECAIEQKIPTAITLTPKTRAVVGEQLTFTATLKQWDEARGKWRSPTLGHFDCLWVGYDTTFTAFVEMSRDGEATFKLPTGTEPSTRDYYAHFRGNDELDGSWGSRAIASKWQPEVTVTDTYHYTRGDTTVHLLEGYLRDQQGNPMTNQRVSLYSEIEGQWKVVTDAYTEDSGSLHPGFFFMYYESCDKIAYFKVIYDGGYDDCYWPAESQEYRT